MRANWGIAYLLVVAQSRNWEVEASQTCGLMRAKKRGASHRSPRSFAAQEKLAQDDNFKLSLHLLWVAKLDA